MRQIKNLYHNLHTLVPISDSTLPEMTFRPVLDGETKSDISGYEAKILIARAGKEHEGAVVEKYCRKVENKYFAVILTNRDTHGLLGEYTVQFAMYGSGGFVRFPLPDINNDGKVDVEDAALIAAAAVAIKEGRPSGLTPEQERLADVNRDGVIDERDSRLVAEFFTATGHGDFSNDEDGFNAFMRSRGIGGIDFPFPDLNGDGIVDMRDAAIILEAIVAETEKRPTGLTPEQRRLADANMDGKMDMFDVQLISDFSEKVQFGDFTNDPDGWNAFMRSREMDVVLYRPFNGQLFFKPSVDVHF